MTPFCFIFDFGLFLFCSVSFCVLVGLQSYSALPTQDSHCLPAFLFVWNSVGPLLHLCSCLCFSWLCCVLALLKSKPHHPSICSHVSKCTAVVVVIKETAWPIFIIWEGEKYYLCSYLRGICEKTARGTRVAKGKQSLVAAWAAFVPFTPTDALCAITDIQYFTHKTEIGWDRTIPFLASGFSSVSYHLGGSLPMYVRLCMT